MAVVARIQGHPSRAGLHSTLADALGVPTEISLHASEPPNPWEGYKRCLADLPDRGHLLIVQDDVRVSAGFAQALEKVASEVPTALFLSTIPARINRMAMRAAKKGERYVTVRMASNEFCPVVGILWPVEKALEFRTWAEEPSPAGSSTAALG